MHQLSYLFADVFLSFLSMCIFVCLVAYLRVDYLFQSSVVVKLHLTSISQQWCASEYLGASDETNLHSFSWNCINCFLWYSLIHFYYNDNTDIADSLHIRQPLKNVAYVKALFISLGLTTAKDVHTKKVCSSCHYLLLKISNFNSK